MLRLINTRISACLELYCTECDLRSHGLDNHIDSLVDIRRSSQGNKNYAQALDFCRKAVADMYNIEGGLRGLLNS
jgi:hypothetical protein